MKRHRELADDFRNTSVDGGTGSDSVGIDDSRLGFNDSVTLTGSTFGRAVLGGTISYNVSGVDALSVVLETGSNPVSVTGTSIPTTLDGGGGNDNITAGNASNKLDDFNGNITFLGGSGSDTLTLNETGNTAAAFYESGFAPRSGVAVLTFASAGDLEGLVINGGSNNDNFLVYDFTGGPATLNGNNGNDSFTSTDESGTNLWNDSFSGGAGTDTLSEERIGSTPVNFVLSSASVTGNGTESFSGSDQVYLYGGGGGDTLNAANYDRSISLYGQGGNDSLIGSPFVDSLDGGSGTDIVQDTLTSAAANWVLTNGLLSGGSHGNDVLTGIDGASLTGSSGNDTFNVSAFSAGPVTIKAGAGADKVFASISNFNDSLDGASEDDSLVASGNGNMTLGNFQLSTNVIGVDSLSGFDYVTLTGGGGANRLDASAFNNFGSVSLDGQGGNDTLVGSNNSDVLNGNTGTDRVEASANVDFYYSDVSLTGIGNDALFGIDEASLTGGSSNNNFYLYDRTFGPITIKAGAGNDTVWAGGSNGNYGDLYDLEGGTSDWVSVSGDVNYTANDTLVSSSVQGSDTLTGTEYLQLVGGAGSNTFNASARTTWVQVFAGSGNDTLIGGSGGDLLDGQGDVDMVAETLSSAASNWQLTTTALTGGRGSHTLANIEQASLTGSSGADSIDASGFTAGSVTLLGLGGNDTLLGGGANFADYLDGGSFTDRIVATADTNFTLGNGSLNSAALGNDILAGLDEASLTGGAGANNIDASAYTLGPVTLTGNAGADTLLGGGGADSLLGGPDNDSLNGGPGDDTLTGGADNDN
ncbi:MAG: calcium-binding protein, partial [Anaerolineales bacterium]